MPHGGTVMLEWKDALETVDWNELSELYRVAPLGNKKPADLKTVFTNSMFRCFVYDSGRLVAAGRALADGVDCAYLADIAVHPDYQSQGLGKEIVRRLCELSRNHRKIILYAAPGKDGFYLKLGFKRMLTAMAIFENPEQAVERGLLAAE
jgi:ribosomal protein S18 acetylase RimI-like enzyme